MPKYGGRRYGYGRPGRRVRGYYRARSRQPTQALLWLRPSVHRA